MLAAWRTRKTCPIRSGTPSSQGDICDRTLVEDLLRRHQIDTAIHFAAELHVDRSILDPAPFIQTNVVGTFTLLDAARQVWLREGNASAEGPRFMFHNTTYAVFSYEPEHHNWRMLQFCSVWRKDEI